MLSNAPVAETWLMTEANAKVLSFYKALVSEIENHHRTTERTNDKTKLSAPRHASAPGRWCSQRHRRRLLDQAGLRPTPPPIAAAGSCSATMLRLAQYGGTVRPGGAAGCRGGSAGMAGACIVGIPTLLSQ
jgi:hypothetical protein